MKAVRNLIAALAGAAIVSTPVLATGPSHPASYLLNTVQQTGITVHTRCPEGVPFAGMYASGNGMLAICANGSSNTSTWTADDRDTLRHEAIHLAQDCWGVIGDNDLETTRSILDVFQLMALAHERTGLDFGRIEDEYRMRGADDMTILLEFEAWAGAAVLTDEQVAALVRKACINRDLKAS